MSALMKLSGIVHSDAVYAVSMPTRTGLQPGTEYTMFENSAPVSPSMDNLSIYHNIDTKHDF